MQARRRAEALLENTQKRGDQRDECFGVMERRVAVLEENRTVKGWMQEQVRANELSEREMEKRTRRAAMVSESVRSRWPKLATLFEAAEKNSETAGPRGHRWDPEVRSITLCAQDVANSVWVKHFVEMGFPTWKTRNA